jgi:hypothetical protein
MLLLGARYGCSNLSYASCVAALSCNVLATGWLIAHCLRVGRVSCSVRAVLVIIIIMLPMLCCAGVVLIYSTVLITSQPLSAKSLHMVCLQLKTSCTLFNVRNDLSPSVAKCRMNVAAVLCSQ